MAILYRAETYSSHVLFQRIVTLLLQVTIYAADKASLYNRNRTAPSPFNASPSLLTRHINCIFEVVPTSKETVRLRWENQLAGAGNVVKCTIHSRVGRSVRTSSVMRLQCCGYAFVEERLRSYTAQIHLWYYLKLDLRLPQQPR
jgi:hypothetical protein